MCVFLFLCYLVRACWAVDGEKGIDMGALIACKRTCRSASAIFESLGRCDKMDEVVKCAIAE